MLVEGASVQAGHKGRGTFEDTALQYALAVWLIEGVNVQDSVAMLPSRLHTCCYTVISHGRKTTLQVTFLASKMHAADFQDDGCAPPVSWPQYVRQLTGSSPASSWKAAGCRVDTGVATPPNVSLQ